MRRRFLWLAAAVAAGWLVGISLPDPAPPSPAVTQVPARTFAAPQAAPALASGTSASALAVVSKVTHHPRPPGEWDGMLVDMTQRQYCETSAYCGFALACLDDAACGPCQRDDQCATGEVCVLDHCVMSTNAGCRTRQDCDSDALCVLTGLTGGEARGNSEMQAICQASHGGSDMNDSVVDERRAAQLAAAASQIAVAPPIGADDLRGRLDAELSAP